MGFSPDLRFHSVSVPSTGGCTGTWRGKRSIDAAFRSSAIVLSAGGPSLPSSRSKRVGTWRGGTLLVWFFQRLPPRIWTYPWIPNNIQLYLPDSLLSMGRSPVDIPSNIHANYIPIAYVQMCSKILRHWLCRHTKLPPSMLQPKGYPRPRHAMRHQFDVIVEHVGSLQHDLCSALAKQNSGHVSRFINHSPISSNTTTMRENILNQLSTRDHACHEHSQTILKYQPNHQ